MNALLEIGIIRKKIVKNGYHLQKKKKSWFQIFFGGGGGGVFYKQAIIPAGIYLLKVNNKNTRTICEIC